MRIDSVDTHIVGDTLFVSIATDKGLVGWGQSALWGYPDAVKVAIDAVGSRLVGMDPLARERIWYEVFRAQPFRGSFVSAAAAAIDIALWDIAGQRFDVPCYVLMGGPVRDRIRLHLVLGSGWLDQGGGTEALVGEAKEAVGLGFTAIKFDPFLDGPDGFQSRSWSRRVSDAVEVARAVRDAVGWDIDIAFELHRKFSAAEAAVLYAELGQLRPYMIEDALPPDGIDPWGTLPNTAPTSTGERLDTIWEFADLVTASRVSILRPDVGEAGGLSHVLKIAALAEAHGLQILCHNYVGPLLTLATAQLYASVQNVATMEYTLLDERPPRNGVLGRQAIREGGSLRLPDGIGLGYATIDPTVLGEFTRWRPQPTPISPDGGLYLR